MVHTKLMLVSALIVLLSGCTSSDAEVSQVLHAHGMKLIRTTGYRFFVCGKDDEFSTGFIAKNPKGTQIEGVVCCGLLKGCTVRF